MNKQLEEFVNQINDFDNLSPRDKIDYFIYYLTEISNEVGVTATMILNCYYDLKMTHYSNISKYLTENIRSKTVRIKSKYFLESSRKKEIESLLELGAFKIVAKKSLDNLVDQIVIPSEKEFLEEAIKCFSIAAYRASIVMVWILTIDHLYNYILTNHLSDFNIELAKVTDKRIKVKKITKKDDFSEIQENKFIELCKASGIINNDVRKILDVKLGIRNSSGHPSVVKILESKAIEFIEDLVTNVIIKFK